MPEGSIRYCIASPNVVSESFEDEVVVVNLDSGLYFSLEGSGAACWKLATAGHSVSSIVAGVCRLFQAEEEIVDRSVRSFLDELAAEGLLVAQEVESPSVDAEPPPVAEQDNGVGRAKSFSAPVVNRYSDMRELLLIDPVHMVGDAGWPQTMPDSSSEDV